MSATGASTIEPNPEPSSWRELLGTPVAQVSIVFVIFCALQFGLFHTYVTREVAWSHPANFDQATYLTESYEAFEDQLRHGLLSGLGHALTAPSPTGIMMPLQASLLYQVLGATRMSSLILLFLYVSIAEAALLATVWFLTRSRLLAFSILALYVLSNTRFYISGGIFDFRIDAIASSLYFIFLCLMVRSKAFLSAKLSLACGAAGGLLILFRFAAAAFVIGLLLSCAAILLATAKLSRRTAAVEASWLRLRGTGLAVGAALLLAGPELVWNRNVILEYYGRHLGGEKDIRAAQVGVSDLTGHLLFYPRSLLQTHLGAWFLWCAALFIAAAVVARARAGTAREPRDSFQALAALFSVLGILVPMAILTSDPAPSAVVGSIMVGPVVLAIGLIVWTYCGAAALNRSRLFSVVCGAIMGAALVHEVSAVSAHSFTSTRRQSEQELLQAYDAMLRYAAQAGWSQVRIAVDRVADYLTPNDIAIMNYEKTGVWLSPSYSVGGTIDTIPEDQVIAGIRDADFALVTQSAPGDANELFPFGKEMIGLKARLWAEANASLIPLQNVDYEGHMFTIFVRPDVQVKGVSGGWLQPTGASLQMPCLLLAGKRDFVAAGKTIFPEMLPGKPSVTATLREDALEEPLPAEMSPVSGSYSITFQTQGAHIPASGACEISLTFDRYFIPKERGINADTRKLVIQAPSQFHFE